MRDFRRKKTQNARYSRITAKRKKENSHLKLKHARTQLVRSTQNSETNLVNSFLYFSAVNASVAAVHSSPHPPVSFHRSRVLHFCVLFDSICGKHAGSDRSHSMMKPVTNGNMVRREGTRWPLTSPSSLITSRSQLHVNVNRRDQCCHGRKIIKQLHVCRIRIMDSNCRIRVTHGFKFNQRRRRLINHILIYRFFFGMRECNDWIFFWFDKISGLLSAISRRNFENLSSPNYVS